MQLPYGPEDDIAAYDVVSNEVKWPNQDRWLAMTTDDRVLQTHRVLRAMIRTTEVTFTHRNAELAAVRARFTAGEITDSDRRQAVQEYEEWKASAANFRAKALARRDQIAHRVRQLGGDEALHATWSALRTLAVAVADHQTTIREHREPTAADRLLWLRLDTLTCASAPISTGLVPLADIVHQDSTSPITAMADATTEHSSN